MGGKHSKNLLFKTKKKEKEKEKEKKTPEDTERQLQLSSIWFNYSSSYDNIIAGEFKERDRIRENGKAVGEGLNWRVGYRRGKFRPKMTIACISKISYLRKRDVQLFELLR